jgi:hypothetical protein
MPVGLNLVALGGDARSVNSLYVEAKSIRRNVVHCLCKQHPLYRSHCGIQVKHRMIKMWRCGWCCGVHVTCTEREATPRCSPSAGYVAAFWNLLFVDSSGHSSFQSLSLILWSVIQPTERNFLDYIKNTILQRHQIYTGLEPVRHGFAQENYQGDRAPDG